jgi:hypothetical protein
MFKQSFAELTVIYMMLVNKDDSHIGHMLQGM